jgi:hypothetical protein
MQINKTIETKTGSVHFEGEIEGQELDLVIQTGLMYLLQAGVISNAMVEKDIAEENGEIQ